MFFTIENADGKICGVSDEGNKDSLPEFMRDEYSLVDVDTFLKDCKDEESRINKTFDNTHLYNDRYAYNDDEYIIEISWGDWKHDHLFTDHLMEALGWEVISEDVTEEDGSDCYSATHTYKKKE